MVLELGLILVLVVIGCHMVDAKALERTLEKKRANRADSREEVDIGKVNRIIKDIDDLDFK